MRPHYVLIVLAVCLGSRPGFAQPERYATEAEVDRMLQEMRQDIPNLIQTGFYSDRRTPTERQQQAAFVAAWSEVDGAIAPFLGDWSAIEENLQIYPLSRQGEVCIIDSHLDQSDFYLGRVEDGRLYTSAHLTLVQESGFLVSIAAYQGQPTHYEYANPRPLENPATSSYYTQYHPEIVEQFQQAGCLSDRPE